MEKKVVKYTSGTHTHTKVWWEKTVRITTPQEIKGGTEYPSTKNSHSSMIWKSSY